MMLPPAFKYLFKDSIALGVKFAASATIRTSVSLKSILLNLFKVKTSYSMNDVLPLIDFNILS